MKPVSRGELRWYEERHGAEDGAEPYDRDTGQLDISALINVAEAIGRVPRPGLSPRATRRIEYALLERASELQRPVQLGAHSSGAMSVLRGTNSAAEWWPRTLGLVASIVMTLAIVGGGSVLAASDSLPSSLLYPVKIAGERAQLIVAQSSAGRARALMLIAEHRLGEIEAVAGSGAMVDERKVAELQDEIDGTLEEIEKVPVQNALGLLSRLSGILGRQEALLRLILQTAPTEVKVDIEKAAKAARGRHEESEDAVVRALYAQSMPVGVDSAGSGAGLDSGSLDEPRPGSAQPPVVPTVADAAIPALPTWRSGRLAEPTAEPTAHTLAPVPSATTSPVAAATPVGIPTGGTEPGRSSDEARPTGVPTRTPDGGVRTPTPLPQRDQETSEWGDDDEETLPSATATPTRVNTPAGTPTPIRTPTATRSATGTATPTRATSPTRTTSELATRTSTPAPTGTPEKEDDD